MFFNPFQSYISVHIRQKWELPSDESQRTLKAGVAIGVGKGLCP
jgi:hypothetical protein